MKNNEKIKVKKRNRKRRSRLLGNTKFVLVISVILSVIIWIIVSLSDTNEKSVTVSNIRMDISLSESAEESGLEIFSGTDHTASVSVTGNRVAVGSVTPDDILITAPEAGTITYTGTYALSLTARKKDSADNFEISSPVTPSVITVFVDYKKESVFEIKNKLKYSVAEGNHATVNLSKTSVTISGPQSEVNKIDYVCIKDDIKDPLESDYQSDYDLIMYDKSGEKISNNMLTITDGESNIESVTASITVNPEKELPIKLKTVNFPKNFENSDCITLSTKSIKISGPDDIMDSTDKIYTEEVDLSSFDNTKKTLKLKLDIPKGCENLSEIDTVEATFDFSEFKKKKYKLDLKNQSLIKNLDDGYECGITTDNLSVVIIGPSDEIDELTASDIKCVLDMSDIEGNTGSFEHEAKIAFGDGFNNCWAYGEYGVNIVISENSE